MSMFPLDNQPIWELQTDYYMHNVYKPLSPSDETRLVTDWIRMKVRKCLPFSCSDENKIVKELFRVHSKDLEMIDGYSNYHQSFKWTDLSEHISFEIGQLAMRHLPTFRTNYSPFQRQIQERKKPKNPSLTGQSSTSSSTSNDSSSTSEASASSSDEDFSASMSFKEHSLNKTVENEKPFTLTSLMPPMEEVYGCKVSNPSKENMTIYKRYVQMAKLTTQPLSNAGGVTSPMTAVAPTTSGASTTRSMGIQLKPLSDYGTDSYLSVKPPTVSAESQRIYEEYCKTPRNFNAVPKIDEMDKLYRYVFMMA